MRPTVVHLLGGIGFGGNETLCLQLVRHTPPGVANVVIYQDPARTELLPLLREVPGLRIRCVPTRGHPQLVGAWMLAREMRTHRLVAVLIYAFGLHHVLAALGAFIAGVHRFMRPQAIPPPTVTSGGPSGVPFFGCPPPWGCPFMPARQRWNGPFGSWAGASRAVPEPSPMAATSPPSPDGPARPAGYAGATAVSWLAWSLASTRSRTRRP